MLERILPEEALETVERERALLQRVREFTAAQDPGGEALARIDEQISHLDDMFLLVVVGEVKAGKSAFINALLKTDVCPEGPLPLTDKVHVLGWGEKAEEIAREPWILRRTVPVDSLQRMNVVDTPGTNSPVRRHQEITERFLPRADIVFFVTSIDCPLTQTEIELLGDIRRRWKKEVACILAKVDMHPDADRDVVVAYLKKSFSEHLDFEPPVFAVSAHLARRARADGDDEALERSGLPAVERFIVENLSEARRLELKLRSPLGATTDVLETVERDAEERREQLDRDFAGWTAIQEQVAYAGSSLKERAERQIAPLAADFENLEGRGRVFLRDTIRLSRLRVVADPRRFREAFEREVVRGAVADIEAHADDAVRWLGEETRALWDRSLEHFHRSVPIARYRDEILGGGGPTLREGGAETVGRILDRVRSQIASWDVDAECARVRRLASRSLARLLGTEVAAAGVGTVVAATLLPSLLGGVGIALAAGVAVGGFFLLPARRQKAIEGFERNLRTTRDVLISVLREAIGNEADRARAAILDAFAPFRDFYESRRRGLGAAAERARELKAELAAFGETLG